MKKILSIALALVMMLSCAVTLLLNVSATGTDALEAPVPEFTQSSAVTDSKQNIRFLAGVKSLGGSALGYEIVAEFTYQNSYRRIEYGGENYETNKVFEYVWANGEKYYTSDIYGEGTEYKYWHIMTISDIPTDIGDIYFRVKSYVVDSDGNKTYSDELCAQYVDGKLDQTVSIQNFNNLSGSMEGSSISADQGSNIKIGNQDTGWLLNTKQDWQSGYNDIIAFENGAARLHINGDFIRLVDESVFEGMYKYSIDADVRVDEAGIINFVFNNSSTTLPTANSIRVRLGRYYDGGTISGGDTGAKDGTLGLQLLASTLYTKVTTLPVKVEEQTKNLGDTFHLTIDVNNTTRIASVFVDGALITSISFGEEFVNNGGLYTYIQGGDITIDNLRVYGEEYDSNEKGELLYKQDFNGFSGTFGSLGEDNTTGCFESMSTGSAIVFGTQATGWTLNTKQNWTPPTVYPDIVSFESGAVRLHTNGDFINIIDSSVFNGTYKYSIDVDVKITEAGIINFVFNDDTLTNVLRVRLTASDTLSGAGSGHGSEQNLGIQLNAGTMYSGGTTHEVKVNGETKKLTDAFHLTIDVNNYNRHAAVYVDGVLITTISFDETFANVGGLYTYIQGGDITIDNLTVYGESGEGVEAGDIICAQRFDSASGETTDGVLASVGMTTVFANSYNFAHATYAEKVEMNDSTALKINGGWTAYKVMSASNTADVDAYTIQMDVKFDQNDTSFGNFALIFGGTADDTTAAKTLVQIRNLDSNTSTSASSGATNFMGVGTFKDGTAQDIKNTGKLLTDMNKIAVEVNKTAGTVKVYVNGECLIEESGHTIVSGDIILRVQNAYATVDNIILSVGTYSDYYL